MLLLVWTTVLCSTVWSEDPAEVLLAGKSFSLLAGASPWRPCREHIHQPLVPATLSSITVSMSPFVKASSSGHSAVLSYRAVASFSYNKKQKNKMKDLKAKDTLKNDRKEQLFMFKTPVFLHGVSLWWVHMGWNTWKLCGNTMII